MRRWFGSRHNLADHISPLLNATTTLLFHQLKNDAILQSFVRKIFKSVVDEELF
jgi:hypothetical protein